MTIIDRGVGQDVPAGDWEAVFYQATHDSAGLDVGFGPNWPNLGPVRGAYHFARPGSSSGTAQAALFIARVKVCGWKPDKDLWALDVEVEGLNGEALRTWIMEFMDSAKAALGDRGFLYIGWPFYTSHLGSNTDLLTRYRWWLPAYGKNDGEPHDYTSPFPPVLHQYTSNPFDKSRVINQVAWDALFAPVVVPPVYTPPKEFPLETIQQKDVTVTLDASGNGYFDLPGVTNAAVHSWGVIGIHDPAQTGTYDKVPSVAFTLGGASKVDRFVIVGGSPAQKVTVRIVYG